ncbi:MAG TPA: hypothetical protein VHB18_06175 [Mycobacteriales bacterium]|jgi:hypothetical protein|nr:hypothetical protein [Mycobacteriales bacterium]
MSKWAGTWLDRGMAAACAIVIIVGAFAISGRHSVVRVKTDLLPVPTPHTAFPTPASPPAKHHRTAKPSASSPVPAGSTSVAPAGTSTSTPHATSPSAQPSPTRSAAASTAIPDGVLGTFSYATTGYEQTSIPGTRRTFPKSTTIKNTKQGCGVLSTWKPIDQHTQSQEFCEADGGVKIAAYKTTISFFGVTSGEDFTCSGDSFIYKPGVKAGHVWKYKCTAPDATASQRATVVGYEKVSVGGKSIRTLHVRVKTTLKGGSTGTSTQDYWIWTKKPVLAKESGKVAASQQGVRYASSYSLTLKSLTPKS